LISLFVRFVIIVSIVISVTDAVVFYHLWREPRILTVPFVVLVIIVTIVPIVVNLWYWLIFKRASP
jgi:hypothetical protein